MYWLGKTHEQRNIQNLNILLRNKFGKDLSSAINFEKINSILSGGEIKNKIEYRLLFDYVEDFYSEKINIEKQVVQKIESLLEAYQRKTGKI